MKTRSCRANDSLRLIRLLRLLTPARLFINSKTLTVMTDQIRLSRVSLRHDLRSRDGEISKIKTIFRSQVTGRRSQFPQTRKKNCFLRLKDAKKDFNSPLPCATANYSADLCQVALMQQPLDTNSQIRHIPRNINGVPGIKPAGRPLICLQMKHQASTLMLRWLNGQRRSTDQP